MNYITKRTKHRKLEAYDVLFNDGIKAQVEKVEEGKWHMLVHIGARSTSKIMRDFSSLQDVAEYAHQAKVKEREWAKTNILFC